LYAFRVTMPYHPGAPPPEGARTAMTPLEVGDVVECAEDDTWRIGHVVSKDCWAFVPAASLTWAPPSDARYKVALELTETEEAYSRSLRLVCDTLMAPLSQGAILPANMTAKIFLSTSRIASASSLLATAMRARLKGWRAESSRVGDVMLQCARCPPPAARRPSLQLHATLTAPAARCARCALRPLRVAPATRRAVSSQGSSASLAVSSGSSQFADMYIQYVNGFEQSQRALRQADESVPEWKAFQKHWRLLLPAIMPPSGGSDWGDTASGGGGFGGGGRRSEPLPTSVADLLIRPVQRVPRLKLLLEQASAPIALAKAPPTLRLSVPPHGS
jgi:hypothetical protein